MRVWYVALFFISSTLVWSAWSGVACAETAVLYTQPDDSGEMLSPQPNFVNTFITSASLGNLVLGKGALTLTFSMKDSNASNTFRTPDKVVLGTCATCKDLQAYSFTNADRTLLADGAFHTFTVDTGTTTLDAADGSTPIFITFSGLSQFHNSTHVKSNAAKTIPYLTIEGTPPPPLVAPELPAGTVAVYTQGDAGGVMTNPQPTFQTASIRSAVLGNLNVGQGKLYLIFTMKDPNANNTFHNPEKVSLGSCSGCSDLQTYFFTDEDRALLADGVYHTFLVQTGTTTRAYADGTRPVYLSFTGLTQVQFGTKVKSNAATTIPAVTIATEAPPPDPCATPGACASNVLFLPGIEGSRLYEGTGCGKTNEEKLWEPLGESIIRILRGAGDDKVKSLFLNQSGKSVCSDIYTKEGDIIDSVGGSNIYKSLIDEMNSLESDGTITDWKPVAYDWRLSLTDLLNNGAEHDGKIFYTEATSTPYIEQTLRALAASSKTGKVTIVTHSNGGLVAKALLNRLGSETSTLLVDKIIMVGVPQSGAPVAVGALLYGYDQGISAYGISILRSAVARELAQNAPMAYHLLPSEDYLTSVAGDSAHPVARFAGDGYAKEIAAYGSTIADKAELDDFLLAREGGRVKPSANDVKSTEIANAVLMDYANVQHTTLDFWTPPTGIEVSQIAGWGIDTVAGIDFYTPPPVSALTALEPMRMYRPVFIEDGDGTVPVPSALMMASSTNVKRYWVNLDSYFRATSIKRNHKDLFEIPPLGDFVKNIIKNSTSTLPTHISTAQPPPITDIKKLTFFLHSPLTLQLTDSSGNVTGLAEDGSMAQDIPGSTYGEFGEVKYVTVPAGAEYQLAMHGQDTGTFSLDMQESSGGVVTASSTIAGVPTTANTLVNLTISNGLDTASALTVDEDGDGQNIITITPEVGGTVSYEPPAAPAPTPEPEPQTSSTGGGGGGGNVSTPVIAPVQAVATSTQTTAPISSMDSGEDNLPKATAEPVVTDTLEAATSAKITQVKKKSVTPVVAPVHKPPETGKIVQAVDSTIPQTASVYDAVSQQPILTQMGRAVYNVLYGLWVALKRFF